MAFSQNHGAGRGDGSEGSRRYTSPDGRQWDYDKNQGDRDPHWNRVRNVVREDKDHISPGEDPDAPDRVPRNKAPQRFSIVIEPENVRNGAIIGGTAFVVHEAVKWGAAA